jgi:hypothetical protein
VRVPKNKSTGLPVPSSFDFTWFLRSLLQTLMTTGRTIGLEPDSALWLQQPHLEKWKLSAFFGAKYQ